ncbi:MAG: class I poly(R)-hydroxyalkanoic acid synthase [Ktedonobacter sp. 13_2_20CM_2_56_8]|nr:MAG: class I poly(R)-hydroxyalkanoic acid synthase [Ktedonobacter sp. 13_2_20CM_53_11]OLB56039.1 MAG: class I poly(R)-hydroxyalkanoic acid synthase [Ktedonobacter sp. 13_2_20CM_2_56_8]
MKVPPPMFMPTGQAGEGEKDPWIALIDQLWQANPYSNLLPIDPAEITRAFQQIWLDALKNPVRAWNNYNDFVQQYTQLMTETALKFWGGDQQVNPVVEPEKGDKRFSAPDWQQNAVFDALKQSYLLAATTLLKTARGIERLDEHQQHKLMFYLRQFLDAISPTNLMFTNPQVIHETISTGGQNMVKGMEHLLRDFKSGQIKMTDTDAFAPGRNLALTPGQVIYRNKLIELIQYAPTTEQVYTIPLLFIPPWINKYYILDMQPQNSFIKFLVDSGFTVFIISWKNPDASMEEITFEDYMTLGPLTALDVVKEITGSQKVNIVGYCIGGTLLAMVLSYLTALGDKTANSATFFVSLLDFREVGDTAVFIDEPQVTYIEGQMMERGYLDSRSMASMFNMMRANDLIWSNVVNNYLLGKEPPAFDLLYWNNDGTRMAREAHSFYLRNTYLENNLVKPGKIVLKDVPIDLKRIRQDIYAVGAQQDHIVPWKAAWQISQLVSGKVRFVLGGSGHIAGIINPPSKGKGAYWVSDKPAASADEWLEGAKNQQGSWWTNWLEWLMPRSGELKEPPSLGSKVHPPITPAPGTYVLEK